MIEDFKHFLEVRGLADNTIRAYVVALKQFKQFIRKPLDKAELEDIDDWIWRMKGNGKKHTTINLKLNAIKRYYKFCDRRGEISDNARKLKEIELLTIKQVEREIVDEETVRMMLDQLDDDRDKAILAIMFNCGLRISEIVSLNKKNFEEKEDYVRVRIVHSKRNKSRTVFMNYFYYNFVKEYMESHTNRRGKVFISKIDGTGLAHDTINRRVKAFSRELLGKELTTHDYRASCFTHMYRQGVDIFTIAKWAGHSSIETTKSYIEADELDIVSKTRGAFYEQ